jgi:hypothetical protein
MLVDGPGFPLPRQGAPQAPQQPGIDQTDEAVRDWEFAGNLRQWNYDKMTMSIRLDIESGTLEQILLEAALTGTGGSYAGAKLGLSGADLRMRGADLRMSGADLRLRRNRGD